MNIKEKIGERILEQRQLKGLTRKALASLTDDIKPSRINNWERGIRTPGPVEIKQLSEVLEVSPGYLMCLTDIKNEKQEYSWLGALIPFLDHFQASEFQNYIHDNAKTDIDTLVPLCHSLSQHIHDSAFAIQILDDSMSPELLINDIVIIDPEQSHKPGNLVLACRLNAQEILVRRYKQISVDISNPEFELIANNSNWANIKLPSLSKFKILGVVTGIMRNLN